MSMPPDRYDAFAAGMAELLRQAETMAQAAVSEAERHARELIDDASARAERIMDEARLQAETRTAEAEAYCDRLLRDTEEEINRLRQAEEQLRTGLTDAAHWLFESIGAHPPGSEVLSNRPPG